MRGVRLLLRDQPRDRARPAGAGVRQQPQVLRADHGGEDGAGEEQQTQGLHLALLREGRRLPRVTRSGSEFT